MKKVGALDQALGLLGWDQHTMMPPRGAEARAEEMAALEGVLHDLRQDAHIERWLVDIDTGRLDAVGAANVRETKRQLDRARRQPAALVTELARLTSIGQETWAKARRDKRFADFAPTLERIVALKREQAKCLATTDTPYDALIDTFEPGTTTREVADLFGRLRGPLAALLARVVERKLEAPRLGGPFPAATQMQLARLLAERVGYDFERGRLDASVHPFTSGGVPGDVRITTRVDENDPINCLYSTLHEAGHAMYEQGIDGRLALMPAGESVSLGVHESQSRLWENQVGRSRAFATFLHPLLSERFAGLAAKSPDELYRAVNHVQPSFIRTESDEVSYNLHIILRFELEQELIADRLKVRDLEAAWNDGMRRQLGMVPPDASLGVLQDVHWASGAFGYFPTYTLGNVYAAELFAAARRDMPQLEGQIERGELAPLLAWLRDHVHRHGKVKPARTLVREAIGHEPTEQPLLAHLSAKCAELYGV